MWVSIIHALESIIIFSKSEDRNAIGLVHKTKDQVRYIFRCNQATSYSTLHSVFGNTWNESYFSRALTGPAQGLGNLGLGVRPYHKIFLSFTKKRVISLERNQNFIKNMNFFQIIVHFLLLEMLGISQILLQIYKLTCFNLYRLLQSYHQTKTPISFWCRRGLNPRSLIQLSETLPVELTGTHKTWSLLHTIISFIKY